MTDFTIDDMINSALESKPETFKDAFSSLMVSKLSDAIEQRKQEIAQSLYSDGSLDASEEQEDLETIDYEEADDGENTQDDSEERD